MIPKHQQINVWMNMSETPEKKKARLRYDNVFLIRLQEVIFLIVFHNYATVCVIKTLTNIYICKMLISIFSWFFHTIGTILKLVLTYIFSTRDESCFFSI